MSDPRRASDNLLIQLVREGRHDAEIGIRLGINTGEVRARKADLRARLGEDQYLRLTDSSRPQRRSRNWRRFALIAAGVICAVALLLVIANILAGDAEEIAEVRTVPSPTARPTPRPAAAVTIDGELFDDAGAFIALADTALPIVGVVENRAGFSVFNLNRTAFVSPSEFVQWAVVGGGRGQLRVRGTLNGRAVDVSLSTAEPTTRLRSISAGVGPIAEVSSQLESVRPAILVRAYDSQGRQLQVHLRNDGGLLVAKQSLPSEWLVDRQSGQRMTVEGGVILGAITESFGVDATNFCKTEEPALRCGVTWLRSAGVQMVSDGLLTCVAGGYQFESSAGLRLSFSRGVSVSGPTTATCETREVAAGTVIIPPGDYEVLATSSAGERLSVGITVGGRFIVGQFGGDLRCPCLSSP